MPLLGCQDRRKIKPNSKDLLMQPRQREIGDTQIFLRRFSNEENVHRLLPAKMLYNATCGARTIKNPSQEQ